MPKKRSLGLTILGWTEIILGVGGGGVFLFMVIFALGYNSWKEPYNFLPRLRYIGIYFCVIGIWPLLVFITGIGILKVKQWSWKINMFIIPSLYLSRVFIHLIKKYIPDSLMQNVFFIYEGMLSNHALKTSFWYQLFTNTFFSFVWLLPPIFLIFYLTRPGVKAQFFNNQPDQEPRLVKDDR